MGLFDLFSKKPVRQIEWHDVAASFAGTLWIALHQEPKLLANPLARVVLHDDWSVGIACDKRSPDAILGERDVSFAFFREDDDAYQRWLNGIRPTNSAIFQQFATEEFARFLVQRLAEGVQVVDRRA